ncbi:RNase adapter RapZ [Streptomyces sp. NPDC126499]|uniref:RapZ C-terminal domain-containing protein n=1 Tax=Streptomyces sp. NPDC126499 TaxID=3155314 RepID=UPI003332C797
MTVHIRITSYGTGHNDPPAAANPVVVDTTSLRNPPDDPAVRRQLTQLTGLDPTVATYVMNTPGAEHLVDHARRTIEQRIKNGQQHIDVHVHCYGGRHRSVAIAEQLGQQLRGHGRVHVQHRHINQPILPSRPR